MQVLLRHMDGEIEKANGDSAIDVMRVLELASKSLIGN